MQNRSEKLPVRDSSAARINFGVVNPYWCVCSVSIWHIVHVVWLCVSFRVRF